MSSAAVSRARRGLVHAVVVALTTLPASSRSAADDKPAPPPAEVATAQKQYLRWVAAFTTWRKPGFSQAGETAREATIRQQTRLLVLATPTPRLDTQRRLDGHAMVVSAGLISLLDELLLAEAMSSDCFRDYAAQVGRVLGDNRRNQQAHAHALREATAKGKDGVDRSVRTRTAQPLADWPRLSVLVDSGEARDGCAVVKPSVMHSAATQDWTEDHADSLALWLYTHQAAVLAADAAIETAAPKPSTAASATPSPAPSLAPSPAPAPPTGPPPSPDKAACLAEIDAAAKTAAAAASTALPTPVPAQRARLALCTSERAPLQTLHWLQDHLSLFRTD